MKLDEFNSLGTDSAIAELLKCCSSTNWAKSMLTLRPFTTREHLNSSASSIWSELKKSDWLEAFDGHPRIGGDKEALRKKFPETSKWAEGEQSSVAEASETVLDELASLNELYLEKFDFIFIICATGKTAEAMLNLLKDRINNDSEKEIQIAANEQEKITLIRLEKII
jgi:2-oxo-4-hydroxy-4-carboxy-5-ureidoimidazoline decarboxylase